MPASMMPWPPSEQEPKEVETSPNGRYIRYNILLGKGACKRVYKGLDTEEGLEVAWNQVELLGMDRDEEARQHLQEEIRVLQQLKHKNIMTFYAWWYDKSNLHINFITELFTAGNLRQYRRKIKILSENVLKRWAHQILEGLLYLHGHTPPIVHRDLKCDNIFINSATGEIKIGDLGLATVQQTAMSVVGTPEFMAPEVYDESYDEKCDIYSFGMCLLELATQEYPYAECHSVPQIFKKVTLGIPPASLARVSTALRDFISTCIAHNPADRPSARELLKHPYLESVRLTTSDSYGLLPSGLSASSCNALASMSPGGGSGWSTPKGTMHCAASVRDLREALHQQEALARHHQQQLQQQLHMLHSSCPDPHAVTAAAAAAAATATAPAAAPAEGREAMQRSSTGPMTTPPPPPPHVALSGAGAVAAQQQPSRLSQTSMAAGSRKLMTTKSFCVAEAQLAAAAAAAAEVEARQLSGGGGGGGGTESPAAGNSSKALHSVDSSAGSGDSDVDSDEEVLVPIEMIKAGLLEEGFVDGDAGAGPGTCLQDAGSDPSAVSLVDPVFMARLSSSISQTSASTDSVSSPAQPPPHHGALARSSHPHPPLPHRSSRLGPGQQGQGRQEPAATASVAATGGEQPRRRQQPEDGGGAEAVSEPGAEGRDWRSLHSGEGEEELELTPPATARASGPSLDLDPWAQRWALRGSLEAMLGFARGSGGSAGVASPPAVAAPAFAASGAAAAGRHSRNGSNDTVTFSTYGPAGASGTCTPALRTSFCGAPSVPPPPSMPPPSVPPPPPAVAPAPPQKAQQPPATAPEPLSRPLPPPPPPLPSTAPAAASPPSSSSLSLSPSAATLPAAPPVPLMARGSLPEGGGGSPASQMVRLPSFRNRVLLTMVAAKGSSSASAATGTAPPPAVAYFRSASARLDRSPGVGSLPRHQEAAGANATSTPPKPPRPGSGGVDAPFRYSTSTVIDLAATGGAAADGIGAAAAPGSLASASTESDVLQQSDDVAAASAAPPPPSRLPGLPEGDSERSVGRSDAADHTADDGAGDGDGGTAAASPAAPASLTDLVDAPATSAALDAGAAAGLPDPVFTTTVATAALTMAPHAGEPGHLSATPASATPAPPPPPQSPPPSGEREAAVQAAPPAQAGYKLLSGATSKEITVIKETTRPIQGIIMRLKQLKRLMKDRGKNRKSPPAV